MKLTKLQIKAKNQNYSIFIGKNILDKLQIILKKNSINSINNISEQVTSDIIEKMSGDKLNDSSIKATVEEVAKKNVGKYL